MSNSMTNIEISHVTVTYPNGVTALDDISLSIGSGIYGLLGHNGAGKSTLMKVMTTLLSPSSGTVRICGFDTAAEADKVRQMIGYLPQELTMYPTLTVFDFVNYMALLKGIRDREAVSSVLEQVGMLTYSRRKIGQLSGGMKRRTAIAQALIGTPKILIADEPTAGLDPEERLRFQTLLTGYAQKGRTVIFSTHIVEDVHRICRELAVLRDGRLFFSGSSAELMRLTDKEAYAYQMGGNIHE